MSDKKICVFTQTYSNNREELYKYHELDFLDVEFRNNFDLNLYAFHNSDQEYVEIIKGYKYLNNLKDINIIYYTNLEYTQTFRHTLHSLLNFGYDYIIFLQDDSFTNDKNINIEELVKFIKNEDFDILDLERSVSNLNLKNEEIYYESNGFTVYNTTSDDFKNAGFWAFDDGPYIANIKFILREIYDEHYFNIGSIWPAEHYLNNKINNKKIQKLSTNISLYNRYNIVGMNTLDRDSAIEKLEKNLYQ
jgi:hypothetical protein